MDAVKTWLTAAEAAAYVGASRGTIHAALESGELRGAQITRPKGRWRIKRAWLDEWLEAKAA